jgi:hypothetical protein
MTTLTFTEKLSDIQKRLKAPKSQFNKFGNYAYRNQEDILEAVKPLLAEHKLSMTVSDEIVEVGGRVYVRATVTVSDGMHTVSNSAFAREPLEQKGMNEAQITGSASSYARKYALNGMFLIDDTKDADATNTHGKEEPTKKQEAPANKAAPKLVEKTPEAKPAQKSGFQPKAKVTPETKKEETNEEDNGDWS